MKLAALPAAALGLLALAGPAAAQSTTRPAGAGASASASATGTKVQATDLAAGDFPLWDPDNCRPENFGGKHEWSPGGALGGLALDGVSLNL